MPEQDKPQVPNYVRVQNYILDKCKSGEYAVGTRIPSETELARMFSVSRITLYNCEFSIWDKWIPQPSDRLCFHL